MSDKTVSQLKAFRRRCRYFKKKHPHGSMLQSGSTASGTQVLQCNFSVVISGVFGYVTVLV